MTTTTTRRTRTLDVAWMTDGACLQRGDLPWIADPEQSTPWERLAMGAACQDCPVATDCTNYVKRAKVTAGFWAGRHRDPDAPKLFTGPGWAAPPLPGLGGAA
jgi:hypothetical protein